VLHVFLCDSVIEATTNQTLGGEEGVLWVLYGLTLGNITDVTSAILSKGDDRGSGPLALSVLNDLGSARL